MPTDDWVDHKPIRPGRSKKLCRRNVAELSTGKRSAQDNSASDNTADYSLSTAKKRRVRRRVRTKWTQFSLTLGAFEGKDKALIRVGDKVNFDFEDFEPLSGIVVNEIYGIALVEVLDTTESQGPALLTEIPVQLLSLARASKNNSQVFTGSMRSIWATMSPADKTRLEELENEAFSSPWSLG